ncbi:hypothetical protein GCM10027452_43770 [Micromonospora halotolerans]
MLRSVILAASRSSQVERLVATAPFTRDVVRRFVAGAGTDDALRATRALVADGQAVTLDNLGEDTVTPEQANATRDEYLKLLRLLGAAGLTPAAEVSVKLSALGQMFDEQLAYDNARAICAAADAAGTTVTRCSRRTCGGPSRTAASCPAPGPGCGSARARTRSPSRWRTSPPARSTSRTCAA